MSLLIPQKVRDLFGLLDEVEALINSDTVSLPGSSARKLATRLHEVACLVEDKYLSVAAAQEITSETDSTQSAESVEDTVEYDVDPEAVPLVAPAPSLHRIKREATSGQSESADDAVKFIKVESASSSSSVTPTPPPPSLPRSSSAPTAQPTPSRSLYQRTLHPEPEVDDEHSRKRKREAAEMVKKLERPKTFSCGVQYQGDSNDKRHSDDAKDAIKRKLPALRNNRHLFNYMVWATMERIDCNHCRKCPNTYQAN